MRVVEDECVGCPPEIGCLGKSCPNKNVKRYFCDYCENEYYPEELFQYEGSEICQDCLLAEFPLIEF